MKIGELGIVRIGIGRVTVRSVRSHRTQKKYFAVGILRDGKWKQLKDGHVPLLYPKKPKANECAAYLNESRLNALKEVSK